MAVTGDGDETLCRGGVDRDYLAKALDRAHYVLLGLYREYIVTVVLVLDGAVLCGQKILPGPSLGDGRKRTPAYCPTGRCHQAAVWLEEYEWFIHVACSFKKFRECGQTTLKLLDQLALASGPCPHPV